MSIPWGSLIANARQRQLDIAAEKLRRQQQKKAMTSGLIQLGIMAAGALAGGVGLFAAAPAAAAVGGGALGATGAGMAGAGAMGSASMMGAGGLGLAGAGTMGGAALGAGMMGGGGAGLFSGGLGGALMGMNLGSSTGGLLGKAVTGQPIGMNEVLGGVSGAMNLYNQQLGREAYNQRSQDALTAKMLGSGYMPVGGEKGIYTIGDQQWQKTPMASGEKIKDVLLDTPEGLSGTASYEVDGVTYRYSSAKETPAKPIGPTRKQLQQGEAVAENQLPIWNPTIKGYIGPDHPEYRKWFRFNFGEDIEFFLQKVGPRQGYTDTTKQYGLFGLDWMKKDIPGGYTKEYDPDGLY